MQKINEIENINLIRKIAWSFTSTTGIDFEDLFSEAVVSYYEALNDYNASKGKLSVWCWLRMKNNLINYIKQEMNETIIDIEENPPTYVQQPNLFFELLGEFDDKANHIIKKILDNPHKYLSNPPKLARGIIRDELRKEGWKWVDIWDSFRSIKTVLQN